MCIRGFIPYEEFYEGCFTVYRVPQRDVAELRGMMFEEFHKLLNAGPHRDVTEFHKEVYAEFHKVPHMRLFKAMYTFIVC